MLSCAFCIDDCMTNNSFCDSSLRHCTTCMTKQNSTWPNKIQHDRTNSGVLERLYNVHDWTKFNMTKQTQGCLDFWPNTQKIISTTVQWSRIISRSFLFGRKFGRVCCGMQTPSLDWEDSPSSIVLSDSKESLPKQRCSRSISCLLTILLTCPATSLSGSCPQSNSSPIVWVLVNMFARSIWKRQFQWGMPLVESTLITSPLL